MGGTATGTHEESPRILVLSTNSVSDPGIDLAGSRHIHYPPGVRVINVPCSSGVKPGWIVHALEHGFDGVFVATDGDDCSYLPDCNRRSAGIVEKAQALAQERGISPARVKMSAICSVCGEPFATAMNEFSEALTKAAV